MVSHALIVVRRMTSGFDLTTLVSVSSIVYFIIGLLVGVILKRAFIVVLAIIALVVLLIIAGFLTFGLSLTSLIAFYGFFNLAKPAAVQGVDLVRLLPWTSLAFLIGVGIGLWKG
jgi:hypothetical protein